MGGDSIKKPTMKINQPTAIMGFGNPVRSDDAVGIYVIEQLRKRLGEEENLKILDMGTAAFEVLFQLQGQERIILVDGVINTGEPVGTLFKVPASEVQKAPQDDPLVFLHSIKWDQALSYTKKILGEAYPKDIHVYLIAIDNTRLELDLSREAKAAGDKVVELIINDLNESSLTLPPPEDSSLNLPKGNSTLPPPEGRTGVGSQTPLSGLELQLKACHLVIADKLVKEVFGDESHAFVRYYPERKSLLLAPVSQAWFKKMHQASQFMLKYKNKRGDKTVAIHEILIDNEIDEEDKTLAYEIQGKGKVFKINL